MATELPTCLVPTLLITRAQHYTHFCNELLMQQRNGVIKTGGVKEWGWRGPSCQLQIPVYLCGMRRVSHAYEEWGDQARRRERVGGRAEQYR
ncbi:hypothetical protein J6590_000274 [Homalodisca vitripennis]|nr:hypothetical protein J6590_000274 [Homalodisca vitripennis]